jgi:hypothetical protein
MQLGVISISKADHGLSDSLQNQSKVYKSSNLLVSASPVIHWIGSLTIAAAACSAEAEAAAVVSSMGHTAACRLEGPRGSKKDAEVVAATKGATEAAKRARGGEAAVARRRKRRSDSAGGASPTRVKSTTDSRKIPVCEYNRMFEGGKDQFYEPVRLVS